MNERPANWPPEATPEQIAAHIEQCIQRDHQRDGGKLVWVPEGHSFMTWPTPPEGVEYDGRSAD